MSDAAPTSPPGTPASIAVVALDVGGTDMKTAVLTADNQLLDVRRSTTPRGRGAAEAIIDGLADALANARAAHPHLTFAAAGLSVPGLVDDERGIGLIASNLGWSDFPFRDRAEARLGLPVAFGHDVRSASLAERELGAAAGIRNVAVVVIGTGIASSIIVDGHPLLADGFAGEIGHSIVDPNGEQCACGGVGHLETVASASAIARRYGVRTGEIVPGSREVLERAQAGDADAQAVWDDAVEALALGLSQVVAIAGPEAIVIGGGLAQAGDALLVPVAAALDARLSFHRRPRLITARLGENAGLLGTGLAARGVIPQ